MFGSLTTLLAISGLAMLSAGGLAYVFLYGRIQNENTAGRRLDQIQARGGMDAADAKARAVDPAKRRKSVQETLKELDEKQKAKAKRSKSPPLMLRMEQAGLSWTRRTFLFVSLATGAVVFLLAWLFGAPLYASAAFALAGVFWLPRAFVNRLRKRRIKRFLEEFANAVDVIVRGVKAGLPVNDCLRIIAGEAAEPVKTEFKLISESQALGVPLAEAVGKLPERVPVPEANFFAIVIAIQQRAGGNLSEALGNLSRVLRDRQRMKGRINALSMEARASAAIIGALPFIVMVLVYISSPAYIMTLFTHPVGNIILAASAIWMTIGILVMRKMINFDF